MIQANKLEKSEMQHSYTFQTLEEETQEPPSKMEIYVKTITRTGKTSSLQPTNVQYNSEEKWYQNELLKM